MRIVHSIYTTAENRKSMFFKSALTKNSMHVIRISVDLIQVGTSDLILLLTLRSTIIRDSPTIPVR